MGTRRRSTTTSSPRGHPAQLRRVRSPTGQPGFALATRTARAREARRRGFLRLVGILVAVNIAAAGFRFVISRDRPTPDATSSGQPTGVQDPPTPPSPPEKKPSGTNAWRIPHDAPETIEGYADRVSVQRGERVGLFVSTEARRFHVEAYRIGYYGGREGLFVWRSRPVEGEQQPAPMTDPSTNMVEAPWRESLAFHVGQGWQPGAYLLKLKGSDGGQGYVPLVVRDDASRAALLIQLGVTTWQAYNTWGGYSLYHGPDGGFGTRSRVVSFDRPYDGHRGAGGLLGPLERPLIILAERMGLGVTYWTDLDLHERPDLLTQHNALVTLGHDEYWSGPMVKAALAARDEGVNIAFLGANAVYRHIRLEPSPLGKNRRQVGYKVAEEDPLYGVQDRRVTADWRVGPVPRPESVLTGALYQCNPVLADMVIADADAWPFAGTGLGNGDVLPNMVALEYDQVDGFYPTPETIQILAHSPLECREAADYADMSYYTTESGAGVLATGTQGWVPALRCPGPTSSSGYFHPCDRFAVQITRTVLRTFARGPAGAVHPSTPNLADFGIELEQPIDV
jgi:hypothetical protein